MPQILIVPGIGLYRESRRRAIHASQLSKKYEIPIIFSGYRLDNRMHLLENPESIEMYNIALEYGIPSQNLFTESSSVNTAQNLYFSKRVMESTPTLQHLREIGIVDNKIHLMRTLYTARFIFPKNYSFEGFSLPLFSKDNPNEFISNIAFELASIPFEISSWTRTLDGLKKYEKSKNLEDIIGRKLTK